MTKVILTLLILGLKCCGRLLPYLYLPPWANVIKLFIGVFYCHYMVFNAIMMFYNTQWQQYHGMTANYQGKKFHNIGPRCLMLKKISPSPPYLSKGQCLFLALLFASRWNSCSLPIIWQLFLSFFLCGSRILIFNLIIMNWVYCRRATWGLYHNFSKAVINSLV